MKTYKKPVTARTILLSAFALLAVGLGIYDVFFATAELKANAIFNFLCGFTTALGGVALVQVIRRGKEERPDEQ